ncbi:MAG: InlB B-repeat-containing protein, partial [Mycoplasmatales bacterium]
PPAEGDRYSGFKKTIYGPDGVTIYDDSTYLPDTNEIVWRNVPSDVNELYFSWDASTYGPSNGVHTTSYKGKIKIIIEDSYSVNFDANGGQGTMNTQNFVKDIEQPLSENEFTKLNNSFIGWNTKADGTGESYTNKEVVSNKNMTLYAQWSQNFYNIAFDSNTGNGIMNGVLVNQGDTALVPNSTFTKVGYNATHWNTKADGTGKRYNFGDLLDPMTFLRMYQGDIVLYAQWEIIPVEVLPPTIVEPQIEAISKEKIYETGISNNITIYVLLGSILIALYLIRKLIVRNVD